MRWEPWLELEIKSLYAFGLLWMSYYLSFGDSDSGHNNLMVLNSFNFYVSEKLFISQSILHEILAGYRNLGCQYFPFSTLNISCHSLLACRVSTEKSAVKMEINWINWKNRKILRKIQSSKTEPGRNRNYEQPNYKH